MIELFRQRITCRIDRTIHEVYILPFKYLAKFFLGLSASNIHAQRQCLFVNTLQTIH